VRLRPIARADLGALVLLQDACWPPELRDDLPDLDLLARWCEEGVSWGWCAIDEAGALVGAAFAIAAEVDAMHVYAIEVDPAARRQGVAHKLLRRLMEEADAEGLRLTADVCSDASRLFAHADFAPTGAIKVLGGEKFGRMEREAREAIGAAS